MINLHYVEASKATNKLYVLTPSLDRRVYSYTAYIMNGVKFVSINWDVGQKI